MCFVLGVYSTKKEISERFDALFSVGGYKRSSYLNAFGYPQVPVLLSEDPRHIVLATWGLIPHWVKDASTAEKIRKMTLNARSETAAKKPSFRSAFNSRHALVITNGFYEWRHLGKQTYPYYIQRKNKALMAIAGLYEHWTQPDTGEVHTTFSVLTKKASELMEQIHNTKKRMPVILTRQDERKWLALGSLGEGLGDSLLAAFPVTKGFQKLARTTSAPFPVRFDELPSLAR
jgi:putative SOS response-associated peptidase YedK